MKVDFNGLRKRACVEVNSLADWVDTEIFVGGNKGEASSCTLRLNVAEVEELANKVNRLVSSVYAIAATYDGDNPEMRDLTDEIKEPIYIEVGDHAN